ncbi:MAG: Hsp20/alpha crystallin family protein [Planctomycetota bacterium]|nr:MAG: Hsp20/alpha crystallin family protein [Planctomycetota bacterium]
MLHPLFDLGRASESLRGFSDLARLVEEVQQLFDHQSEPDLNVYHHEQGAVIQIAVPGYAKDELHLDVDQDQIVIRAKGSKTQPSQEAVLRSEIRRDGFERQIRLPFTIDGERTEARHEDGILTIAVAKPKSEQPRRIAIG